MGKPFIQAQVAPPGGTPIAPGLTASGAWEVATEGMVVVHEGDPPKARVVDRETFEAEYAPFDTFTSARKSSANVPYEMFRPRGGE